MEGGENVQARVDDRSNRESGGELGGGYTCPPAIMDTAGVSGGEEAGYISIGCEEYDTGDIAGVAKGADGGRLHGVSESQSCRQWTLL